MKNIREYLQNEILIADGAAGTYISSLTGRISGPCEMLNITSADTVLRMHKQYVKAGAKLILTNTFSASVAGNSIGGDFDTTSAIIKEGVKIASMAAQDNAYVAADIGPLPETMFDSAVISEEYRRIVDTFLASDVNIFVFETFSNSVYPIKFSRYIKNKNPEAFIIISFAVMPDGYSRENISGQRLIDEVAEAQCADAVGFNCCCGPSHLLNYAQTVDFRGMVPVIMPNAGYPQRESGDLTIQESDVTYSGSPSYFASRLSSAASCGFKIIGGCCGTTPRHIAMLSDAVSKASRGCGNSLSVHEVQKPIRRTLNTFSDTLLHENRKTVVVELEPPFNADISKLENAAKVLKDLNVDAITVADSPMARARADSLATAARLKRTIGIEVIPHLCCRDKNLNAIKSSLISAYIEGIRNILAVTGDPIPDTDRALVKGVFNLNSESLCRYIRSLNSDIFSGDEIFYGCAFNVNAKNPKMELKRLEKKLDAGASFVLTQPVFTDDAAEALKEAKNKGVKVIAGLVTPVNYKNAVFLANEMPGFNIPEKFLKRFSPDMTREQGENEGIAITIEIARKIAHIADGFYFVVPFNRVNVTKRVIEALRADGII
ncbi:homocysteine S-methyltransferase [[Clostridium] cellulosi]|uniref:Homocysteine S-methyltransferase n=1 Tax=[Clostridium] cellulosi TaxID=29343 RepID=A0A078KLB9_9FIRM|nr:homocysteine S-methyltransferase [[Clostridium] cellulosi]